MIGLTGMLRFPRTLCFKGFDSLGEWQQLTVARMGGPTAWHEAQQKREAFKRDWEAEANQEESDSEESEAGTGGREKRDLYAEYDIDPETMRQDLHDAGNSASQHEGTEGVGPPPTLPHAGYQWMI
jgi:hypothetical protein